MRLLIRAVSLAGKPLTQAITGVFDDRGGIIGRSETCTLMLPDPERHISRAQAEVTCGERGYTIRNISHANPIVLNGRAVPAGRSALLAEGDELQVGSYLLAVNLTSSALTGAPAGARPGTTVGLAGTAPRPAVPAPAPAPAPAAMADPFAGLDLPPPLPPAPPPGAAPPGRPTAPSSDPFAALWGSSGFGGLPAADTVAPATTVTPMPSPLPPAPARPAEVPWTELLSTPATPTRPPAAPPAPFAAPDLGIGGMAPALPSAGLDDLFGLTSDVKGSDAVDQFLKASAPPAAVSGPAGAGGVSLDPLAMFAPAAPAAPVAPVHVDRTPEIHAAMPLPRAAVPASPVPVPAPVTAPEPAPVAADGDTAALWRAFCEGAGLDAPPAGGLTPERMRVIGAMLRHGIDGTMKLIAARAATKVELHAQVTMIQPRNNNPLKFSPDARVAIGQLLQPPLRGFLGGPDAIEQAMDDLLGHAFGTMAGMRAALDGVLDRFAPDQLEAKLTRQSVFDSLLPMHRRARLWELYLQHYQSVREDAREDFHALFGKAFLQAYEEQLDRLDASRQPDAGRP